MSSGTSTPRATSTTPTPPATSCGGGGSDPSALTVGTQFVKRYYNVLSTSPEDIDRFYQSSTSVVTRGEGSDPAVEVSTDFSDGAAAARFLGSNETDDPIRFEFEHGAIDAQFSVNSGIVLVVTGQVVYVRSELRKSFVQTFFLINAVSGVKRSYYVHNDILRFLEMEKNGAKTETSITDVDLASSKEVPVVTVEASALETLEESKETTDQSLPVDELSSSVEVPVVSKDLTSSPVEEEVPTSAPIVVDAKEDEIDIVDAPGHGVEESKEAILDDEVAAASKLGGATAPVTPGSWASLVARTAVSSSVTTASPPATPKRPDKTTTISHGSSMIPQQSTAAAPMKGPETPSHPTSATITGTPTASSTPAVVPAEASSNMNNNSNSSISNKSHIPQQQFRQKREAECTLIIKNIDESVTEAEIRAMFEPFAVDTTATYVGCTVHGNRGIAFVDFDTPEPVVKAVKQNTDVGAFMIRDRKLDIYQKIFVDKNQHRGGDRRGSYRGGSGGNARFQGGPTGSGGGRDFSQQNRGTGGGESGARSTGRSFRRGGSRDGRSGGRAMQSVATSGDNGGQ
jgi:Nuclear transport factor 2 (NTF2) domain/RNA recognition motif. (a.k.a. RRM, RBD, or RNP domain)